MKMTSACLGLALLLTAPLTQAEIIDANAHGFQVRHVTVVDLPPDAAYRIMTSEIHRWWHPDHSWSGDASNFHIEQSAGGCWCETWTTDDGRVHQVEHLRVAALRPGAMFRATGGLGPLQEIASTGSMTWTFKANGENGTTVQVDYLVAGWQPDGMESWSGPVDYVIGEQVQRYTLLINTGAPTAP